MNRRAHLLRIVAALALLFPSAPLRAAGPEFPKPLFTGYDEKADAAADIARALAAAVPQAKRLLLIFGANWCGPCRKLHGLLHSDPALRALLAARYEVVSIDVNGGHNKEVVARYGSPTRFGLPALVILAADGRPLFIGGTRELAEGNHQSRHKVLTFLRTHAELR